MKKHIHKLLFIVIVIVAFIAIPHHSYAAPDSSGYAWSENVGWIDMSGMIVSDTSLSGNAWSSNIGWISLNCDTTTSCATVDYRVNNSNGVLSGYAWSENVGWIDFSGVSIDPSTGVFSGYAYNSNIGWISFNCSNTNSCSSVDYQVTTSWRGDTTTTPPSSSGGSSSSGGTRYCTDTLTSFCKPRTTTPPPSAPTPDNPFGGNACSVELLVTDNMKQGDRNGTYSSYNQKNVTQVNLLQEHMNRLLQDEYGAQASGPVDGIFGPLTKQGVMRLQQRLNELLPQMTPLVIDGVVGPFTKAAINQSC